MDSQKVTLSIATSLILISTKKYGTLTLAHWVQNKKIMGGIITNAWSPAKLTAFKA